MTIESKYLLRKEILLSEPFNMNLLIMPLIFSCFPTSDVLLPSHFITELRKKILRLLIPISLIFWILE